MFGGKILLETCVRQIGVSDVFSVVGYETDCIVGRIKYYIIS